MTTAGDAQWRSGCRTWDDAWHRAEARTMECTAERAIRVNRAGATGESGRSASARSSTRSRRSRTMRPISSASPGRRRAPPRPPPAGPCRAPGGSASGSVTQTGGPSATAIVDQQWPQVVRDGARRPCARSRGSRGAREQTGRGDAERDPQRRRSRQVDPIVGRGDPAGERRARQPDVVDVDQTPARRQSAAERLAHPPRPASAPSGRRR